MRQQLQKTWFDLASKEKRNASKQAGFLTVKRCYLNCSQSNLYFTKRECQCVSLISKGKTNKEIARLLGLSPRTIETYILNIREKVHCQNRKQIPGKLKEFGFN